IRHLVLNLDKKEHLDPEFKQPATSMIKSTFLKYEAMQGLHSLIFYLTRSDGGDVGELRDGQWTGHHITIREKEMVYDLNSWKDTSDRIVRIRNLEKFNDE
ncbi:hypothetical protein BGX27_003695, partial [Mortierella sp. AM989]